MKMHDKLFENLLSKAIKYKCSDIHITFIEDKLSILYRRHKEKIDEEILDTTYLYEKLKYYANFNMSQSSRPQSGSFTYIMDQIYYFRYSTIETLERKQGVLRILNINTIDSLETCLQSKAKAAKLSRIIDKSQSLILICGRTGSGKSTTLYTTLSEVFEKKTYILENAVEQLVQGTIQLKIDEQLTLDQAITEILRHDPDIIALGEIRTHYELKQAIRASYSGHCVISTIHCGHISQLFNRMIDLGCSYYDILYTLNCVVFQSLSINKRGETKIHVDIYDEQSIKTLLEEFKNERQFRID